MGKDIVLSGIRATGKMHLGNYLGAIHQFVQYDRDSAVDCFFFIANLHSITSYVPPEDLRNHLRGIVLDFIACGIRPEVSAIYAQSSVPEISELSWLLNCLTLESELLNMAQYKAKKAKLEEEGKPVTAGLLDYPVLMSADILGSRANLIPVGGDQHQHVELARDLARRFNRVYQEDYFSIPVATGLGLTVPGLSADGKMGKSDSGEGALLNLSDSEDEIRAKFRVAPTDPARVKRTDAGTPEKCPIWAFHELFSQFVNNFDEKRWAHDGCVTASIGCVECKRSVAARVNAMLDPIRERRVELDHEPEDFYLDVLSDGGKRARVRFAETVEFVKQAMGVSAY